MYFIGIKQNENEEFISKMSVGTSRRQKISEHLKPFKAPFSHISGQVSYTHSSCQNS